MPLNTVNRILNHVQSILLSIIRKVRFLSKAALLSRPPVKIKFKKKPLLLLEKNRATNTHRSIAPRVANIAHRSRNSEAGNAQGSSKNIRAASAYFFVRGI